MPRISQFYGIVIAMYYDDHAPPHFHAYYSGEEATFRIADLSRLEGRLPRRAESLVREWAAQHRLELEENWQKAGKANPSTESRALSSLEIWYECGERPL